MIFGMAKPGRRISTPAAYRREYTARTKLAREAAGLSRSQVIARLSETSGREIAADTYRKWEKDVLLPHDLIVAFCEVTRINPSYLLDGPVTVGRSSESRPTGRSSRAA